MTKPGSTAAPGPKTPRLAAVGNVEGLRDDLRRHVPAIGWINVDAAQGARHLGLPSDLYLVTVYCSEGLLCGEPDEARDLEAVVTSLRSRPCQFHSLGRGELAVALLTPLGLFSVFGAPLHGIADRRLPLEYFCGRAEQRRLREALMSVRDTAQRMLVFGRWLERRALERRSLPAHVLRLAQAATTLQRPRGRTAEVGALAAKLSITRRQLERDFRKWMGVTPAGYARLARFQRAAAAVARGEPLIRVAVDCGFSDQAHLTRVIRELTSVTPRVLWLDACQPGRESVRAAFAGRVTMLDLPSLAGPQG